MLGVVISIQKHNDKSSILSLYTREKGRTQCVVYGNKWKSTLTPMAEVEVSYSSNKNRVIPSLDNVSLNYVPKRLHSSVQRQCVAMFIAEVIGKTLRHPMEDTEIFDYISQIIRELDTKEDISQLPQQFLIRLSELLGYGGEPLEEWKNLKSTEILRTIL